MKKLAVLVLSALLVLTLVCPAAAEEPLPLLKDTYTVEDNQIICKGLPVSGQGAVTVTADGVELTAVTCSTYAEEEIPITFLCVVDLSKNLSAVQRSQMNEALQAISDQMRPADKMILVGMGAEFTMGEILPTKEDREAAIRRGWTFASVTYIDRCMLRLVEELTVPGKYSDHMSIIVLSDGLDDISSQQAENQAYDAVENSGLTINTITLVDSVVTNYARNRALAMDKFAQLSVNGLHFTPSIDAISASDAAKQIVDAAHNAPVLRIDGGYLDHSGEAVALEALCVTDSGTYASAIVIHSGDIAAIPAAATEPATLPTEAMTEPVTETVTEAVTETTAEAVTETTEAAAQPQKTSPIKAKTRLNGVSYLLVGGIAAAILGVVLLLAAIVAWRRDEAEENDDDMEFMDQDNPPPVLDVPVDLDDIVIPDDAFDKAMGKSAFDPESIPQGARGCRITLTAQPKGVTALEFFLPVNNQKTIGRTQRADYVLDGSDNNLSGCHFALQCTAEGAAIRDCSSTNGTMLNGTPLEPEQWQPLHTGDTIYAGSREYQITAQDNLEF